MNFVVAELVLLLSGFLCPLDSLIGVDGRGKRIIECPDLEGTYKHRRVQLLCLLQPCKASWKLCTGSPWWCFHHGGWHASMSPHVSCHQQDTWKETESSKGYFWPNSPFPNTAPSSSDRPQEREKQEIIPENKFILAICHEAFKQAYPLTPAFFVQHFFTQTLPPVFCAPRPLWEPTTLSNRSS